MGQEQEPDPTQEMAQGQKTLGQLKSVSDEQVDAKIIQQTLSTDKA